MTATDAETEDLLRAAGHAAAGRLGLHHIPLLQREATEAAAEAAHQLRLAAASRTPLHGIACVVDHQAQAIMASVALQTRLHAIRYLRQRHKVGWP